MGRRAWSAAAAVCLAASAAAAPARADEPFRLLDDSAPTPPRLLVQPDYDHDSVYAPPEPYVPNTGINEGGVTFTIDVAYLTDYVFRGVDEGERIANTPAAGEPPEDPNNPSRPDADPGNEDSAVIQVDASMKFDLGKAPHPFVGVFVNTFNADPESRFQEIRPYFGLEWTLRPVIFTVGHNTFIYPDRDQLNTAEIFGKISLDDSYFFRTDDPIFSPYIFAAYDYDLYDGLYMEAGIEHDFIIEGTGIVLTAQASLGYVNSYDRYTVAGTDDNTGLQHYQLGLIGSYRLNPLLGIPSRYGDWTFKGYLFFTDGIENNLQADQQVWGGAGIGFSY
jgi:hypothetical protein